MHALYFVRYIYCLFVVFLLKKKKNRKKIPFRCFSFRRSAVPCSVVPRITNNPSKEPTTDAIFFVWSTMREYSAWENEPAMSYTFWQRGRKKKKFRVLCGTCKTKKNKNKVLTKWVLSPFRKKKNLPYVLGSALILPLKKSSDNVTVSSYSHEKTYGLTDPLA